MFMCAAAAAALGTFGTATQATLYGGGFDPPPASGHFTGDFLLDITDSCFQEVTAGCQVDLVSLRITSSTAFGGGWFSTGQANIANSASLDGGLHFNSVEIPLTGNFFDAAFFGSDTSDQVNCNPCVQFTTEFTTDFFGHGPGWIANLFNSENNNAIYVTVPEPGTLALVVGGIGAAWLRRRRKAIA
jgi:hypothetical protein